ncbi:E3 ubiquitin-protein ligase XBAT33-like [Abeliophyllum distichum]|uniref:E3 ubiquitin-protein ligase XBAT33-like n=1 Tax=Abeliophyllum distichum TaxID=126358 RepID=A0ABD1RA35_9LAMI
MPNPFIMKSVPSVSSPLVTHFSRYADILVILMGDRTALMQACRYGHWEIVQTLLLFRCNVTRADYLSGRTALHFAAVNGHVRCLRLVIADFVPSAPFEPVNAQSNGRGDSLNTKSKLELSSTPASMV